MELPPSPVTRRRLSVALDATPALAGNTGVGRYVRQLTEHLAATGVDVRPFAIGRGHGALPPGTRRLRLPLRVVHASWRMLRQPDVARLVGACDVVHTTDLLPPPSAAPVVLTIHDMAAVEYPSLHPARAVAIQRRQLARAREVEGVIADSQSTADVIVRSGADADRVVVVPLGLTALGAPSFARVPSGPFLLAVGAIAARKGLEVLVGAFAAALLPGCRLVLAGPPGFGADRIAAVIEESVASDAIVVLGAVTDADLAGLYQRCLAVCVPSWAEGFGFSVLEACGAAAPVIASDLAVLREVGGSVPVYVAAGDVAAWTEAISAVAADADERERMAGAGPAQAAQFSWRRCADETAAAYARALGR